MSRDIPFEEVARFHGHVCPGLAIGYRMTRAALRALGDGRAEDEELVAVVENDACGVDAVQYLAGCTFGKGNLIFHDHGKQAYTLFQRSTGRAVRVTTADSQAARAHSGDAGGSREERIAWLRQAPDDEVVVVRDVDATAPERARIRRSVTCARCGERVMETRARFHDGAACCIPCASEAEELESA